MTTADQDPSELIRQLKESFQQIKLGGGFVGKTSRVALALVAIWTVVIFRLSDNYILDAIIIFAAGIITAFSFWWINKTEAFVQNNPSIALLEGAQFLEYQKFEAQMKGVLSSPQTKPIVDPSLPAISSSALENDDSK
ncbi:hypothetical protein [Stenotrophobium rhamnosiphilum]|uniref:Uncharacterized protein n=1 Tax=Stenotrophobium rhamnosiphilum TaxID=2029166 RepID=A0A2T5MEX4_9GAMM|nr:hypothetical protein [Stenotrophobium rhamnosiphilum]PTU31130.1 hypothetical protein CJD38_12635 [Stenotrophobium rhamnosiphilum]